MANDAQMPELDAAIDRLKAATPKTAPWTVWDFSDRDEVPIDKEIAIILNAVVSGELTRADLCASGQQVRAVEMLGELLAYDEWRMHNGGVVPDRFLGVINRARDAYRAAVTPAPQPEAATPTAQEAVPVAWRYRDARNVKSKWTVQKNRPDWWKGDGPDGYVLEPLYAHPPQPSVSVAEAAVRALTECICDMEAAGINSPASAHAALRVLKGDNANG